MGSWSLESFHTLTRVVADLRDSTVVNSLAITVGVNSSVVRAMAAFGEAAVEPLVDGIAAGGSDATFGMIALRAIVEGSADRPLSAAARGRIRSLTEAHLARPQHGGSLLRTIDLAIALDDPGLRTIVQSLATDSAAVVATGVTDPALIQRVRQRAADRLAGIPAPPAPR